MRQGKFTLESVRRLTEDTYELILSGESAVTAPGQFVNIQLPGRFLRRPISVCDWEENALRLLVKAVGEGTRELVSAAPGTVFDLLTGLGNGFDVEAAKEKNAVLVGGGIGAAPLYGLARRLIAQGARPAAALGFRSKADAFYQEEFAALGCTVYIATEDGSLGTEGFVTEVLQRELPEGRYVCACGPTPMLRAVCRLPQLTGGQFSFEARMGCGFGACVGCTVPTENGPKRICRDGPILTRKEIIW